MSATDKSSKGICSMDDLLEAHEVDTTFTVPVILKFAEPMKPLGPIGKK